MYVVNTGVPARVRERLGWFVKVVENKYYFDVAYDKGIVGPLRGLSGWFADVVDKRGIDGAVNGLAAATGWVGSQARRLQTGMVGLYASVDPVGRGRAAGVVCDSIVNQCGSRSEQGNERARQTQRARSRRAAVKAALTAYVASAARLYPDEVLSITLYGSQARGDAKNESDIDVLVVVRRDSAALRQGLADLAWQVQFEHGVVISDIIRSVEQFNRMRAESVPVLPEHRARRRLTVEEHVRAYARLRLSAKLPVSYVMKRSLLKQSTLL